MKKHLKKLAKKAKSQGWRVKMTKNQHIKFTPPDKEKRPVYHGSTSGDHRAFMNLKKDLERLGLKL